jgi:hypothetical protein
VSVLTSEVIVARLLAHQDCSSTAILSNPTSHTVCVSSMQAARAVSWRSGAEGVMKVCVVGMEANPL